MSEETTTQKTGFITSSKDKQDKNVKKKDNSEGTKFIKIFNF